MMKLVKYIDVNNLGVILKDKFFKDLTTIKVGGKIKFLYYPNSIESLIDVLIFLNRKKLDYFVIGNGSNIVASDRCYKKLVINGKHLIKDIIFKDDYFIVSAFSDLRKVNISLIQKDISTFINLSGIPATIGGAICMNAGAFKSNISDNLVWVEYICDGVIKRSFKDELTFSYRNSSFKNNNFIIINAAFKIIHGNGLMLKYNEINSRRKEIHPLNYANCGSVFKNFENIKAYSIIKKIGLVNYNIGDANFSDKHSNFIINKGNARGNDIYKLIILAKKRAFIYEKIILEEEVILLNFYSYSFFKKLFKNLK